MLNSKIFHFHRRLLSNKALDIDQYKNIEYGYEKIVFSGCCLTEERYL